MSDRYRSDGGPPERAFSIVQRVRFGDLDAMQHMNNVEYLRFFETARIDYLMGILPEHKPGQPPAVRLHLRRVSHRLPLARALR